MVDFTKQHELRAYIMETTGGPAAGGLTVRDVFACTAMGALMEIYWKEQDGYRSSKELLACHAESAYEYADAMLDARITLPPKQEEVSLEEAFGFEPPKVGEWMEVKK